MTWMGIHAGCLGLLLCQTDPTLCVCCIKLLSSYVCKEDTLEMIGIRLQRHILFGMLWCRIFYKKCLNLVGKAGPKQFFFFFQFWWTWYCILVFLLAIAFFAIQLLHLLLSIVMFSLLLSLYLFLVLSFFSLSFFLCYFFIASLLLTYHKPVTGVNLLVLIVCVYACV